jgi:hypothetical protein
MSHYYESYIYILVGLLHAIYSGRAAIENNLEGEGMSRDKNLIT